MRSWSARKRQEQFAQLADQPWETKPTTEDRELARLAGIAAALRALSRVSSRRPRPPFRNVLRWRLVASAAAAPGLRPTHAPPAAGRGHGATHRAPRDHPGHRRVAVGVAAFTVATVAAVSAVSAAGALPGDPFYGVKRAAQSTALVVATSELARGRQQLDLAAARLAEISQLLERDSAHAAPAIGRALRDMDARTRAGSASLTRAYRRSLDIRPLNVLDAFARDQRVRLAALLPALPEPARSKALESLRLVEGVGDRTVRLLGRSCRTDASCARSVQAV